MYSAILLPKRIFLISLSENIKNRDGHTNEVLANKAGKFEIKETILLPSKNTLYIDIKAYGTQLIMNPAKY